MATRGGGKRPQRGALSLGSAGQREVANAETRTATNQVNSSWELLHDDVLELIADRVLAGDLLDYIWFRASCKTWRAATPCSLGRGVVDPRFHPRQWTMFPEGSGLHPGHPALGGYIRFLNIYTGIFIRVHLPCFEDHSVLDCPDGLLLLQRNKDASICLLHPFTGDAAEFPPLASLCLYMTHGSHKLDDEWHEDSSAFSWKPLCPDQMTKPYLVDCHSELLVIVFTKGHSRHVVLRLADFLLGVPAVPLTSIGDHALFIGTWSMTVNSKNLPSIQGNSITVLNPSKSGRL
ncbi:unnamed protein product [Alopecurus aequalis]